MKDKLAKFFETEFHYAKVGMDNENDPNRRHEICWNARQRGLGAITFAQECGLDYDTAEKMFYDYCNRLEAMEYEVQ